MPCRSRLPRPRSWRSRAQPLVVDEIALPDALDVGQVLVQGALHHDLRRADQRDRRRQGARQVPAASARPRGVGATVLETGPGVTNVKPGDTVVLHWRPSHGIQSRPPAYRWRGQKLNAGWVTTFNEYAVVSENRMTRSRPTSTSRSRRCSAAR